MELLRNPRLPLFIGGALISLSPVWVKLVSVSPTVSGFYRVLIGGGALAVFLLATGRRLELSRRTLGLLLLGAAFFAVDLWSWHRSIIYIGPGLATLIGNFQVFFMTLAGLLLLNQRPHARQLMAIPLALTGLVMIVGIDWQALPKDYQLGILFGLVTAVTYAGYMLTLRQARARAQAKHRSAAREVAVVSLLTAALLGIAASAEGVSLAIPSVADASWLLSYGIISHCVGWLLIAGSLPKVSAAAAGIALLLQPALSFIWDILFFARDITPQELIGAVIVLGAIYLGSR
jgi:drug/metabolite transporter (DMT)-like permease